MHNDDDLFDDAASAEAAETEAGKSKSQRKREAHGLQDLGEALLAHPVATLRAAGVPDALCDAVAEAQRIRQRSARKRQLQFIGKLMRGLDPAPIQAVVDRLNAPQQADTATLHRLERWRERLIEEGDSALSALLDEHPELDRQHLRRLARDARSERDKQAQPARQARALFRYLRDHIAE